MGSWNFLAVRATKDSSGHWYIIPNELCDEFEIMNGISEDDEENNRAMDEKFGKYRTGGDLNNVQLFIEEK